MLLAMRLLLLLLLFRSLTASPACYCCSACLFGFGDLCIYPYNGIILILVYQNVLRLFCCTSYNRISGKLTATIVNLINFLGG